MIFETLKSNFFEMLVMFQNLKCAIKNPFCTIKNFLKQDSFVKTIYLFPLFLLHISKYFVYISIHLLRKSETHLKAFIK